MNAASIQARNEALLNLWATGAPREIVAREVGLDRTSVNKIVARARRAGDARAVERTGPRNPQRERVLALAGDGMAACKIARGLGLSRNAVLGLIHRARSAGHLSAPRASAPITLARVSILEWRACS